MKNFLNNRMTTVAKILVIATGSISIIGMTQAVMGLDGGNINGSIIACVYGACKDNTFNGGTSGGGGQPTPNTATLIVIKKCNLGLCAPSDFQITVSGVTASPSTFPGNAAGTTVTVSPGTYTVSENTGPVAPTFSDDCAVSGNFEATGTISAGQTQKCTITNGTP